MKTRGRVTPLLLEIACSRCAKQRIGCTSARARCGSTCSKANESSSDGGELGVLTLALRTRRVTETLLEVIITGIRRCGDSVTQKANLKRQQAHLNRFGCSMALATFSISASDSSEIRRYLTLLRCFTTA